MRLFPPRTPARSTGVGPRPPDRLLLGLVGALAGAVPTAHAEPRPSEGGAFGFDDDEVLETWDDPDGRVRVHFSLQGNNAPPPADDDGDGIPDYAQLAARTVSDALAFFADTLELRPPVSEPASDIASLGGSDALDLYLVDFDGAADGRFGTDDCETDRCSGFLIVENDFRGYAYPSTEEALRTVGSHETFHAIQNAYAPLPSWLSEGTAVWAQRQFDPDGIDFVRQCNGLLRDPSRSLFRPPPGPVPPSAYGTALWWDFLTDRHDPSLIGALLDRVADHDDPDDAESVLPGLLEDEDDALSDAWTTFVRWNLATGSRAGRAMSHPYADRLDGVEAEETGRGLDVEGRFFPMAASYWQLEHLDGPLWFAADGDVSELRFSMHRLPSGARDGPVSDPVLGWEVGRGGLWELGDGARFDTGVYWVTATFPAVADDAKQARVCLGARHAVEDCAPPSLDDADDDAGMDGGCRLGGRGPSGIPIAWLCGWLLLVARRSPARGRVRRG